MIGALQLSKHPAAAFAIIGLFWGSFAAHVPVLKGRLGAGDGEFGLLLLGTGFGLVSAMWLAPRVDLLLRAKALPVASVLFIATFLLPALARDNMTFFLALVVLGATSGLTDVMMNTRVSELEARSGRPLMNANHGVFSLAYAVAALFSGAMRELGVPAETVFSGLAVACIPLAMMTYQEIEAPHQDTGAGAPAVLVPVLLCGAVVLIAFMTEATVETWSSLHIERTLLGGAAEGATGPAVLGMTMAIGRFSGQVYAARFSEYAVILAGTALAVAGIVAVALAPGPAVAYLGFGAMGLGISVVGPLGLALVGRLGAAEQRSTAISRVAVIGFAGFFVAPLVMGQLSQHLGLRAAFGSFALLLLLVVPLVWAISRLPIPAGFGPQSSAKGPHRG